MKALFKLIGYFLCAWFGLFYLIGCIGCISSVGDIDLDSLAVRDSIIIPDTANKDNVTVSLYSSSSEVSRYCGARTKNGGTCMRRVKNGNRCWQH